MNYKINGKEIEFDVFDLDASAKLEDGLKVLDKEEKKANKTLKEGKLKDGVQALYSAYQNFFINVTGIDVVDGCNNAIKAQKYVIEFVKQAKNGGVQAMTESIKSISDI